MHKICLVFKNHYEVKVEVIDENLEGFFDALEQRKPYLNREHGVGFWLPPENLMYAYSTQQTPPEEPCQNNPNLDQENDLPI